MAAHARKKKIVLEKLQSYCILSGFPAGTFVFHMTVCQSMTNQKPWQTGKIRTRNCGSLQPLQIMEKQKKDPLLGNNESLDGPDGICRDYAAFSGSTRMPLAGSDCRSFGVLCLSAFATSVQNRRTMNPYKLHDRQVSADWQTASMTYNYMADSHGTNTPDTGRLASLAYNE